MNGTVRQLFHYPIKGLSPQPLATVELQAGRGFPLDRAFGFARHDSGFDPAAPRPLPKQRFFMLMRDAALAALKTRLDPDTLCLTARCDGAEVLRCDLATADGRAAAESFLACFLSLGQDRMPVLVRSEAHRFTDISVVSQEMMHAVSLINLASVADLGSRMDTDLNPLRFRANIYFEGWPPGAELGLVGHRIQVGDVTMQVCMRTQRCAATEVDPVSGERDLPVPKRLMQSYGHPDMGVYAQVLQGGTIQPGDAVHLTSP